MASCTLSFLISAKEITESGGAGLTRHHITLRSGFASESESMLGLKTDADRCINYSKATEDSCYQGISIQVFFFGL